jgi:YHS domain-containing protein
MKILLFALALAASPAFAHDGPKDHAKHGEHANAPTSFDKQPPNGTWAKCSVSGDSFQVGPDTQFATYKGRVYAFCCPDCKPDFDKDPAKYADKR